MSCQRTCYGVGGIKRAAELGITTKQALQSGHWRGILFDVNIQHQKILKMRENERMNKAFFYGQNKTVVWAYWYWRDHDWGNGPGSSKGQHGWFKEGDEPRPYSESNAMRNTSQKSKLFEVRWDEDQEPPFAPVKISCEMYLTPTMQEYLRREHLADVHCYFKVNDDLGKIPRRCEVSYYYYPALGYSKSEEWVKDPPHNGMEIADNVRLSYFTT